MEIRDKPEEREAMKAVFISYAREDTPAARRITEAFRSHGIEVWFDENELRGGESWDAKIRKQINDCSLFIPLISRQTEERSKGYFRLEWKLAVEQTHLMLEGVPFLAPVVIDDTPESSAAVPAEFLRVQWTRLPGALPTPPFVGQIRRLLESPRRAAGGPTAEVRGQRSAAGERTVRMLADGPQPMDRGRRTKWVAVVATAVVGIGVAAYFSIRPIGETPPVASSAAPSSLPALGKTQEPRAPGEVLSADKSIAVLPFANLSDDQDANAFFADGIHEDILTNLALIRELRVVSRTSVMGYRNTTKKIGDVARELGVTYVLEGSVRRAGNEVRVTGQLIRAATDEHLWAKSYDRELKGVFAIQAALAQEIAGALKTVLSPEEKSLLNRQPTENVAAYDLYLRSRTLTDVSSHERTEREITLLRAVVELDPEFAEAWAELASRHALFVRLGWDTTSARVEKLHAAKQRALALAPESPNVIGAIATMHMLRGELDQATAELDKLLRLQPRFAGGHSTRGGILRQRGQWPLAIESYRAATELDPGNLPFASRLTVSLAGCRRWEEAARVQQRRVALAPDNREVQTFSARLAYFAGGSTAEGAMLIARLSPAEKESRQGIALRKTWATLSGDFREARRLDLIQPYADEDSTTHPEQTVEAAAVCLALGDPEAARGRLGSFPEQLRGRLAAEPTNPVICRDLAVMEAIRGNKEEALQYAQRAVDLRPEAGDGLWGPEFGYSRAKVLALTGEKAAAVTELQRLLRIPSFVNVHELRTGPWFVSLRGNSAFEALLNDPRSNAPLF